MLWFKKPTLVPTSVQLEMDSLRAEVDYLRRERTRLVAILFGGAHGRD